MFCLPNEQHPNHTCSKKKTTYIHSLIFKYFNNVSEMSNHLSCLQKFFFLFTNLILHINQNNTSSQDTLILLTFTQWTDNWPLLSVTRLSSGHVRRAGIPPHFFQPTFVFRVLEGQKKCNPRSRAVLL